MEKWNHNLAYAYNASEPGTKTVAEACAEAGMESGSRTDKMKEYFIKEAEFYNNSEGNLHEEDGIVCEICKNKGFVAKAESPLGYWTVVHYPCSCKPVRDNVNRLNRSGLKNVIEKCRFDTYRTDEPWQNTVKTMAQEYVQQVEKEHGWFFIGGETGAGKSHICTAICRELIHSGKAVQYMRWRDESVKLKACVNDAAAYENAIGELKNAEVLYIDDFFKCGNTDGGIQKPTGADIGLAFEILNYRSSNPRAITILSSESTMDEIVDIDGATGGRIIEKAGPYILNLSGKEKNYRCKRKGTTV